MTEALVYIDSNVARHLAHGELRLAPMEGVIWVYSAEHLEEVRRSANQEALSMLRDLQARWLRQRLDSAFRITDKATLEPSMDPYAAYRSYCSTTAESGSVDRLFEPILSALMGADSKRELDQLPDKVVGAIRELLPPVGSEDPQLCATLKETRSGLQAVCQELSTPRTLNDLVLVQREMDILLLG